MESVVIKGKQLYKHPIIPNLCVSKDHQLYDLSTKKIINREDLDVHDVILFGLVDMRKKSEHVFLKMYDDYYYNPVLNQINGKQYKYGSTIASYPKFDEVKFRHPVYKDLYVNLFGIPYKEYLNKTFRIIAKNIVRFHDGDTWVFVNPLKFAYECFHGKVVSNKEYVAFKTKYVQNEFKMNINNLVLYEKKRREISFHPKFKDYGYDILNNEVYSLRSKLTISTEKTLSLYDKDKKYYYSPIRFIYECKSQSLLTDDEFVINDKKYNIKNTTEIIYEHEKFNQIKSNPEFYISAKDNSKVFFSLYNRILKVKDGKVNIGTFGKPNLIDIN